MGVEFRDLSFCSSSVTLGSDCLSLGLFPPRGPSQAWLSLAVTEAAPGSSQGLSGKGSQGSHLRYYFLSASLRKRHTFLHSAYPRAQPCARAQGKKSPSFCLLVLLSCINYSFIYSFSYIHILPQLLYSASYSIYLCVFSLLGKNEDK